jgi:hypothetical protein
MWRRRQRPNAQSTRCPALDNWRLELRWRRVLLALLLVTGLMSLPVGPRVAYAEPADSRLAQARRLFSEAEALEQKGHYVAAAERIRRAISIKETPGLRYHLAFCQEHTGQLVEALANYDRAQQLLDAGAPGPDVAELLGPARTELMLRVPTVQLRLRQTVADARVRIGDRELSGLDAAKPVLLNPGSYQVVIDAPGYQPERYLVVLAEGDRKVVHAALSPLPYRPEPPRPKHPPPEAEMERAARTAVFVAEGTLGALGLSVGVGYGIARSSAAQRAEDARVALDALAPPQSNPCADPSDAEITALCARLREANADGARASRLANYGFLMSGVAAVAALATWYFWDPPPPASALRLRLAPAVGGGACGLAGSF